MVFSPGQSLGFTNPAQGGYLQEVIARVLQSPYAGTPVEHHQAQLVEDENFTKYGQADWLGPAPGQDATGVTYVPNPDNPLRGIFCRAPYRPQQDRAGITYVGEMDLYLPKDPGEVFVLEGDRPKRQDKFIISGGVYYATAPVMPCQAGELAVAFKISLSRERFPVRTDNHG
jgi:hypothetical protein